MFFWLIGVIVLLLIWSALWKRNLLMAFGVLFGILIAWLLSYALQPYVTGVKMIPVWLPPLPLATVALILFIYGGLVWRRGNDRLPQKRSDDADKHH
jgi:hypothetical protein